MNINRRSLYDKKFNEFLKFWNSEVEKKLFRCSKEYGIYNAIKKTLNPKNKSDWDDYLYGYYRRLIDELFLNINSIVDFTNGEYKLIKRKYCVRTALGDKRHLSQLLIFSILQRSCVDNDKFRNVFNEMDKELFRGHKLSAYATEKWNLIKLFFS